MHDDFKDTEFRKNQTGYYLYTRLKKQLATSIFQNSFQKSCPMENTLSGEKSIKIVHISIHKKTTRTNF
jgi:hypothetical protein